MTLSVTVLGATGSIGVSTLDVIARHPERYQVYALTGYSRMAELAEQCRRYRPQRAVVATAEQAKGLQQVLRDAGLSTDVSWGEEALCEVASASDVDVVMAAIVGAAGPGGQAGVAGQQGSAGHVWRLVHAGSASLRRRVAAHR